MYVESYKPFKVDPFFSTVYIHTYIHTYIKLKLKRMSYILEIKVSVMLTSIHTYI